MKRSKAEVAKRVVGRTIHRIHRVLYIFEGEIDWNDAALQLTFTDSSVLLLDGDSDGESLKMSLSPWRDAFSGKLDAENKAFIQKHGKWSLIDVSDMMPYHSLLGKAIDTVRPIFNPFGTLCGVQVSIGEHSLNFVVEADECHILWNSDKPDLFDRGYGISNSHPGKGAWLF